MNKSSLKGMHKAGFKPHLKAVHELEILPGPFKLLAQAEVP